MKALRLPASLLLIAFAGSALAQSNDVGTNIVGSGPFVSGPIIPAGTEGGPVCPPTGAVNSSFTGGNVQLGRIFRDGVASVCPGKAYPGIFNPATSYNFETFTYSNTSGATACVTVNFNPDAGATPCGTNAHASAYINSYNPASQGDNFVGDVGSSVAQPFSFNVPGGSDLVLAVTNTAAAAVCTFAFEVVNLPCVETQPLAAPVNSPWAMILLGLILAGVGGIVVSRRS